MIQQHPFLALWSTHCRSAYRLVVIFGLTKLAWGLGIATRETQLEIQKKQMTHPAPTKLDVLEKVKRDRGWK